MATTRTSKIRVRQGNFADLPVLDPGELGYAKDSRRLFIGNDTVNVGTGNEVSVNFLTESLLKISKLGISAEHGPSRKGEQRRSAIDSKNFLKSFGWKPCVSLEEGLVETFNYFKNKTD